MAHTITLRAQGTVDRSEARLRRPGQIARLQILHLAGMSCGNPVGKVVELGKVLDRCDTGKIEASIAGELLEAA